jgi:hypothetical protein
MTYASRNNGSLPKAIAAKLGTARTRVLIGLDPTVSERAVYQRQYRAKAKAGDEA